MLVTDKEYNEIEDIPEPFKIKKWKDVFKFLLVLESLPWV